MFKNCFELYKLFTYYIILSFSKKILDIFYKPIAIIFIIVTILLLTIISLLGLIILLIISCIYSLILFIKEIIFFENIKIFEEKEK